MKSKECKICHATFVVMRGEDTCLVCQKDARELKELQDKLSTKEVIN